LLTRLALAWSRDSDHKIYVQDRMREVGRRSLGMVGRRRAHVYLCLRRRQAHGQGRRSDALVDVTAQFGARSTDDAIAFVAGLKRCGRYQTDVY